MTCLSLSFFKGEKIIPPPGEGEAFVYIYISLHSMYGNLLRILFFFKVKEKTTAPPSKGEATSNIFSLLCSMQNYSYTSFFLCEETERLLPLPLNERQLVMHLQTCTNIRLF